MTIRRKISALAVGISLLASQKGDAFFGFWDWDNTDCLWDNIRSWDWEANVNATGGYRYDELTCLIDAYDPPGTFISSDDLKAKNLNVWEWGLKGRLKLGNIYAKGWGTFGIIPFGNYREKGTSADGATGVINADVRHGKVEDVSFGLGYLLGITDWLCVAPVGGWSYDYQRIKLKHAKSDGISDSTINGLAYKNRWQGPWAGIEGVTEICCFAVNFGYEYHWAHWHASWDLHGADVLGGSFSDKRESKHATGNVGYINTYWNAWDDFEAGLLVKYQYWRAKNGSMIPKAGSFAAVGLGANEVDKIPHAIWQSIEIQLSLGYTF